MDQRMKKYSEIDYDKEDVTEQLIKRFKYTQQGLVDDIAISIESVAQSTKSIGENHEVFLKVNRALTSFLLETEKTKKEKNFAQGEVATSSIRDRLENITSDQSPK